MDPSPYVDLRPVVTETKMFSCKNIVTLVGLAAIAFGVVLAAVWAFSVGSVLLLPSAFAFVLVGGLLCAIDNCCIGDLVLTSSSTRRGL